ncbi:hypothetical protein EON65_17190 [archaeon]|nr:MAG: hypothetical protein EON65_17190 [archaeon]
MHDFSERVRNGSWQGATGKPLTTVLAIGIGGSCKHHIRACLLPILCGTC